MKQTFTGRTDNNLNFKVNKYNAEGYYSPTEYEGISNVLREEYERKQKDIEALEESVRCTIEKAFLAKATRLEEEKKKFPWL